MKLLWSDRQLIDQRQMTRATLEMPRTPLLHKYRGSRKKAELTGSRLLVHSTVSVRLSWAENLAAEARLEEVNEFLFLPLSIITYKRMKDSYFSFSMWVKL